LKVSIATMADPLSVIRARNKPLRSDLYLINKLRQERVRFDVSVRAMVRIQPNCPVGVIGHHADHVAVAASSFAAKHFSRNARRAGLRNEYEITWTFLVALIELLSEGLSRQKDGGQVPAYDRRAAALTNPCRE